MTTRPRSKSRSTFFFALTFGAVSLFSTAWAQETANSKLPSEAEITAPSTDKVVKMEAFKVTADIASYHETTSSMATKLPMDTKELASSLSIMNATAIKDRNAVTLLDVFSYVVGATQSQGNINGFTFRGFPNTGSYTQNIQFDGLQGATLKKAATSAANVESLEIMGMTNVP